MKDSGKAMQLDEFLSPGGTRQLVVCVQSMGH